jgi:hypothetical protein
MSLLKQFKGTIKSGEETLRFSFSRVYSTEGEKYFVTANTEKGFEYFDMKKDNKGKWRVYDIGPKWVKEFEEKLSGIIERNIDLP